jgi:hypothetical protein
MIKNCLNCAHRQGNECILTGFPWRLQRQMPNDPCDRNLSGYMSTEPQPPPVPRRSLRRWLHDTLWKL